MDHFLIDCSAPFFTVCTPGSEQNWSKTPFASLEKEGRLDTASMALVQHAFEAYCARVSRLGFTALAVDDVAHLVTLDCYPEALNTKIREYQIWYSRLLEIAAEYDLGVFITTDIMFMNQYLSREIGTRFSRLIRLCHRVFRDLLRRYPNVKGIIMRIGEADGVDVVSEFHSRLMIKTPRQLRRLLRAILPLFERYDRTMILRTWTLGAYPVGDLMWNRDTWNSVFSGIESDHLIVSCKYGEADFMKYLELNPLHYETRQRKIIELQTRREYEGFGEFPSFVGYDYERYRHYLDACYNVAGIWVWCQTGGWSHFTRLTFCRDSSVWNELNTHVAVSVFKQRLSAEEAVAEFGRSRLGLENPKPLIRLLRLSEQVVRELWYLPEFSQKRLYFRRIRVPTILWTFWDTIIANHVMRKVLRRFVHNRIEAIRDGYRALGKIDQIKEAAVQCGIDAREIDYMRSTFALLAAAREYFFGPWSPELSRRLSVMAEEYRQRYPGGFHVEFDFRPTRLKKRIIKIIFRASIRTHPAYRWTDRLIILRMSGLIYRLIRSWHTRRLPGFARDKTMGVQVFFR